MHMMNDFQLEVNCGGMLIKGQVCMQHEVATSPHTCRRY
jgi:hypothetical protein